MEITLLRVSQNLDDPQFGVLLVRGQPQVLTLELPWGDNQPMVSCIPEGDYLCQRRKSQKTNWEDTFEVMNVPGRSGILFHWGNVHLDTKGCILVGSALGTMNTSLALLESKSGFRRFMALMANTLQFNLKIRRGA